MNEASKSGDLNNWRRVWDTLGTFLKVKTTSIAHGADVTNNKIQSQSKNKPK